MIQKRDNNRTIGKGHKQFTYENSGWSINMKSKLLLLVIRKMKDTTRYHTHL